MAHMTDGFTFVQGQPEAVSDKEANSNLSTLPTALQIGAWLASEAWPLETHDATFRAGPGGRSNSDLYVLVSIKTRLVTTRADEFDWLCTFGPLPID